MELTVKIPDDCRIEDALWHLSGCMNESQLDYKRIEEGHNNGVGIRFCNDRKGYFYRTKNGYKLVLDKMEE